MLQSMRSQRISTTEQQQQQRQGLNLALNHGHQEMALIKLVLPGQHSSQLSESQ